MRLGVGLGARHSDTARRCSGGARGTQARRRRHGRAGAGRAGAGRAGRAGACGRRTLGRRAVGARGRQSRGARQARGTRPAGRPGRGLGVQLGQWAVHSVHSACFWPGSTR